RARLPVDSRAAAGTTRAGGYATQRPHVVGYVTEPGRRQLHIVIDDGDIPGALLQLRGYGLRPVQPQVPPPGDVDGAGIVLEHRDVLGVLAVGDLLPGLDHQEMINLRPQRVDSKANTVPTIGGDHSEAEGHLPDLWIS